MYPRQQPSTGAYCFWDELCLKGFSNSGPLWMGVGAAAVWIGIALWLSTIHVLFLVSKMNFNAVMPTQLHRISQMQTKVRAYRISCSPDKERPGHKWINCLEVSPFPLKCFFFWYNRTDKWFMKMFVPGRMCLEPVISLLGTNTRANIGLGFFGNICLTLNSDITLSWHCRKKVWTVVLFFGTWEAQDHISALAACFCWPLRGIWLGVPHNVYSKMTCHH